MDVRYLRLFQSDAWFLESTEIHSVGSFSIWAIYADCSLRDERYRPGAAIAVCARIFVRNDADVILQFIAASLAVPFLLAVSVWDCLCVYRIDY